MKSLPLHNLQKLSRLSAVHRGSSLTPTNSMFFECISSDKSIGGKMRPVGLSTDRFESILKKIIKNSVFNRFS